jgi:hypothetical protein
MSRCIEDAPHHNQRPEYGAPNRETPVPVPSTRATRRGVLRPARMLRLRVVLLLMLPLIGGRGNRRQLPLMRMLVVLGLRHFAPITEKIREPSVPLAH